MTDNTNDPFENNQPTNTEETPPNTNPFDDKLKGILNEKGEPKYKDVESALDALSHSQQFIETLKQEKQSIEEKLREAQVEIEKRKSVEEVVDKLTQPNQEAPKTEVVDQTPNDGLSEEKILNLVKSALQEQNTVAQKEQNLKTVVSKLSETYGTKAPEAVQKVATEIGSTTEELQELAKSNPNLVLRLFSDVKVESVKPTQPSSIQITTTDETTAIPKPNKNFLTGGASSSEVVDYWKQLKEATYKEMGVES